MRNIILFFIKFSPLFLFLIYLTVGFFLLVENNPYQRHLYLTSANSASSSIYGVSSEIRSYFNLKSINDELSRRNSEIELENILLRKRLKDLADLGAPTLKEMKDSSRYSFVHAHVINNNTRYKRNYITIDKGSNDGIEQEMGVVDHNGIIGIVEIVGPHSSRVISLLNDQFRLSCKVKGNDYIGSLVWDGSNPKEAVLEELPRHSEIKTGDTIVTSGYSTVFPEGIPVGMVTGSLKNNDGNFNAFKIKLFTNYETLTSVQVVRDKLKDELKIIENVGLDSDK